VSDESNHTIVSYFFKIRFSFILPPKGARQKFDLERFDLRNLDDVKLKEKYQAEISNRFAALESLDESLD
jgi:hypothetical protein